MKRFYSILILLLFTVVSIFIFVNPSVTANAMKESLQFAATTLIPSVFPAMLACDLLFSAVTAAFPNASNGLLIFISWLMGQIGGFTAGAKAFGRLAEEKRCTKKQAELFLCCSVNAAPNFIFSAIGSSVLGSSYAGLCLFISLQGASLVLAAAVVCLVGTKNDQRNFEQIAHQKVSLPAAISTGVNAALGLTAGYCTMNCFSAILKSIFKFKNPYLNFLLSAIMEVSCGCKAAVSLDGSIYLAAACMSVCGLSVIAQISQFCDRAEISLNPFLISRLFHLPLTLAILRLVLKYIPCEAESWISAAGSEVLPFSVSAGMSMALFMLCCCALCGRRIISPLYGGAKNKL